MRLSASLLVLAFSCSPAGAPIDSGWGQGLSFGVTNGTCFSVRFEGTDLAGRSGRCLSESRLDARLVRAGRDWYMARSNDEQRLVLYSSSGEEKLIAESGTRSFAIVSGTWFIASSFEISRVDDGGTRLIYAPSPGFAISDVTSGEGGVLLVLERSVGGRSFLRSVGTNGSASEPAELPQPEAVRIRHVGSNHYLIYDRSQTLQALIATDDITLTSWKPASDSCAIDDVWVRFLAGGQDGGQVVREGFGAEEALPVDGDVVGISCTCNPNQLILLRGRGLADSVLNWSTGVQSASPAGIVWTLGMEQTCW
jgi:hypothetical protein